MKESTDKQESPEVSTEKFTGSFGFIIKPDEKTNQKAQQLARNLFPGSEYQVSTPHITLYHARFSDLPPETVKKIMAKIKPHKGEELKLKDIEVYAGKFGFWNTQVTDSLRFMHKQALQSYKYLEKKSTQRAQEEGLEMSKEELKNTKKFGYPLVNNLFSPHITLAYDSKGLSLPARNLTEIWQMEISDVIFAQMGKFGKVKRAIEIA